MKLYAMQKYHEIVKLWKNYVEIVLILKQTETDCRVRSYALSGQLRKCVKAQEFIHNHETFYRT